MAKIYQLFTVGAIGIGAWLAGVNYERQKLYGDKSCTNPGIIRAATPINPQAVQPQSQSFLSVDQTEASNINRTAQITRFGYPGFDQIRVFEDFVLSYDRRARTAHWVLEHLTKEDLEKKTIDRSQCNFQEDNKIHPFFRSTNTDYKGSGFDRGHLAAAGNHRKTQQSCEQTFLLSNMAPQVGKGFNRDSWNKLEKYVRYLTKHYKDVYVCTGPLYLARKESDGNLYVKYQVIGSNKVAVPTHFFKVIIGETAKHEFEAEAYVMPNAVIDDKTSIFSFQVPIETVEREAGLIFFDKITRKQFKRINGPKAKFIEG
ncbi:hypothetical protein CHUAL_009257 [Chamberlinius hualienensis]